MGEEDICDNKLLAIKAEPDDEYAVPDNISNQSVIIIKEEPCLNIVDFTDGCESGDTIFTVLPVSSRQDTGNLTSSENDSKISNVTTSIIDKHNGNWKNSDDVMDYLLDSTNDHDQQKQQQHQQIHQQDKLLEHSNNTRKFICYICKKPYAKYNSCLRHIRSNACIHHSNNFTEVTLELTEGIPQDINRKINRNNKILMCRTCNEIFSNLDNFYEHINQIHTEKNSFEWLSNFKQTPAAEAAADNLTLSSAKTSSLIIDKNKIHLSVIEDKIFIINSNEQTLNLQRKMNAKQSTVSSRVSSVKTIICLICFTTFRNYSDYQRHYPIHTNCRPYKCNICKHEFNRLSNLNSHLKIHNGVKTLTCDMCNKKFFKNYDLKRHRLVHLKTKRRYKCTICSRTYSRFDSLKSHMLTHIKL